MILYARLKLLSADEHMGACRWRVQYAAPNGRQRAPLRVLILSGDFEENLGDAAILAGTCRSLEALRPGVEISVAARDARREPREPAVRSVPRGLAGLPALAGAARRADLILCGGGGLFQDDDSLVKMPYWALRVAFARVLCPRLPYVITAHGSDVPGYNPDRFRRLHLGAPLAQLYHSSRVFAFPSLQENFPLVLLEAMAAGCAIVTTDATGCAEVVGDAAVRVPPADVGALAQALRRLLSDDEQVHHLGRAARQRVARFAPEQIADEYIAFFERCLGAGGSAAPRVAH